MAAAIDDDAPCSWSRRAPSYAHGVVDPVAEIAAAAAARGVRCHVDACIGGWVLPYAARLGRDVPPWTFAVDGRHLDLRRPAQVRLRAEGHVAAAAPHARRCGGRSSSRRADWPGYTMLNSTMQSTKSGGPLAGAWAVVQSLGDEGYLRADREVFDGGRPDRRRGRRIAGLRVVVPPDSTLVALATDGIVRRVHGRRRDGRRAAGTSSRSCPSPASRRPSTCRSAPRRSPHVDEFLSALGSRSRRPSPPGRSRSTRSVAAFIEALDPASLSDDDFDGLLAAAGLAGGGDGGLALPDADGRGQRAARPGRRRRCARRCWWRSSTG